MAEYEIDLDACKERQNRLLQKLEHENLEGVLVNQNVHVQWLSGVYFPPTFASAYYLAADGQGTLIAPHKIPPVAAADRVERYDAKFHSTMRNDQPLACLQKLVEVVSIPQGRLGVEYSTYGEHARELVGAKTVDCEPILYQLRRKKHDDELRRIEHAIRATGAMYSKAREILEPGISEIQMFNALQTVAVEFFNEPLTGTGNDYQCCSRGGAPRSGMIAKEGELYILDLGPAFRGYYADNARTLSVGKPSDEQRVAWEFIVRALEHVENHARPGKSCRELFQEVQQLLDQSPVGVFNHHLGHGIGLFPHEGPHLNPHWDESFEVGDVFTAEPGLYDAELLRAGIRLENDYVVTNDGVRKLTDFPLDLRI